ncbi:MAG: hypothetical protein KDK51_05165, partial [Deltaproteobacteria bacterium]|nr:hypothetical protein [Deltaproteobacteria bacterium]
MNIALCRWAQAAEEDNGQNPQLASWTLLEQTTHGKVVYVTTSQAYFNVGTFEGLRPQEQVR